MTGFFQKYNDGREKTLFCLAVNLLPQEDLRIVFADDDLQLSAQERAKLMEKRLKEKMKIHPITGGKSMIGCLLYPRFQ